MSTFNRRLIATVFLVGLIILGVYALRWQSTIDEVILPPESAEPVAATVRVNLFFGDGDAQCLLVESRTVTPTDPDDVEAVALAALAALADGPTDAALWPTIPAGAHAHGVTVVDGLATVDYSPELRTNHGGGSAGEILTVGSIAGTLSQFEGIDSVQILLENKTMETLVGHLSLLEPISVDPEALAAGTICWEGIH